ncbi:hypothetical protein M514_10884 [Trichuris suis]|uniref:Uncharacterized protein n=1 Tax=Trichuris suis TaxID=68888 RepID=A0A085NJZ7_9BILA|nr:hypothetical protein M513_10884 [Trichuris suis]KFD69793.1 hypothetical protein M514_10884 [Trichuris suis]
MLNGSRLREDLNLEWSKFSVETTENKRRFDKFTISTIRDVNPSNLSTHIAFRTIRKLGPFEILKRSRTQSSERRLQENNRALWSR